MLPEFESPRIYEQALQDRVSSFSSVEYSLKSRCGERGLASSAAAFVSFCRPEQITNIASVMETMRQATVPRQIKSGKLRSNQDLSIERMRRSSSAMSRAAARYSSL
jgi:hypothetical protein